MFMQHVTLFTNKNYLYILPSTKCIFYFLLLLAFDSHSCTTFIFSSFLPFLLTSDLLIHDFYKFSNKLPCIALKKYLIISLVLYYDLITKYMITFKNVTKFCDVISDLKRVQ